MSRNYNRPTQLAISTTELSRWADCRNTNMAVAAAIHAISDATRSAESIWEDPTPAEIDHVKMAVEEYLTHGDFPSNDDDIYDWGDSPIIVRNPA